MNPTLDDNDHVKISVYTSEGVKYGSEVVISPEMVESMGHEQIGSESLRTLLDVLDKAYDQQFYWENGNIKTSYNEKIWKKIKNINTDDELEEIKHLLGIRDEK